MGEIKSLTGVLLLLLLSVFPYTNASTSNSFFSFYLTPGALRNLQLNTKIKMKKIPCIKICAGMMNRP
jgi:hypothetical protein